MRISAVVAMSKNRVIGNQNQLPWKLPEDLKRFRQITTGHPIILGRKTFESIGRLLPNRTHIIISRQREYQVEGAKIVHSMEEAFECAQKLSEEVFVVGGAEIYRMALPRVDRLYLTLIHAEIEGDTWFPDYSNDTFQEVSREDHEGALPFSFLVLDKKKSSESE